MVNSDGERRLEWGEEGRRRREERGKGCGNLRGDGV